MQLRRVPGPPGGLVLGILPGNDKTEASIHLDLAILTNLGEARNVLNVLTSDIVVGIGMNPGTASEIAHAIKANKDIILLNCPPAGKEFFFCPWQGTSTDSEYGGRGRMQADRMHECSWNFHGTLMKS